MANLMLLCTFGSSCRYSCRWAVNPLYFVSFVFLSYLLQPVSRFSQKAVWLSVTNPIILSWHSYCWWAFLSIQSLPVSCTEDSAQEKKNQNPGFILTNIWDKIKIFTQLYWNLLRQSVIAAYGRLLQGELGGPVINHKKMDCVFCIIQDLSPESVAQTVCFGQSWNSDINLRPFYSCSCLILQYLPWYQQELWKMSWMYLN